MAWLQAASFGISALGHVLNRTGGRKKLKATLADTSFIDDEVETIRSRNEEMSENYLRTANAGAGFGELTQNRFNSAMGVGQATSMLDASMMGGRESAYNASLNAEAMNQGQINQLIGQRANMEQFNAQAKNNAKATNFQAARSDTNNIFGAAQAGMLSFANSQIDNQRFTDALALQQGSQAFNQQIYEQWLRMNRPGNVGSNGVPLPTVPYQSPNF